MRDHYENVERKIDGKRGEKEGEIYICIDSNEKKKLSHSSGHAIPPTTHSSRTLIYLT